MNTTIKCGKCKQDHGSVSEVRACYAKKYDATDYPLPNTVEAEPTPELNPVLAKIQAQGQPITPNQLSYLTKLTAERPMWASVENLHADVLPKLSKAEASHWIKQALETPKEATEAPTTPKGGPTAAAVQDGYYAVQASADTELRFYRVETGKKGKWEGFQFVAMQASDDWYPQKGMRRTDILNAIVEAGADVCAKRYAEEIGRCYVCNRTLTDDLSRELGIGPVCRNKGFGL